MAEIISIVNQKGGVGKTTTASNLATVLAATNKKVLIIDNDPQGNTTTGFGFRKTEEEKNLYDIFVGKAAINDVIKKTEVRLLEIVPADMNLAALEVELMDFEQSRHLLKEKISEVSELYDYIIIDCPPSLGLLTINALVASSSVIIPLQCEFLALEGLKHLINTFKLVKRSLNSCLSINGVLLTMYDRRNNLTSAIEEDVRSCLGRLVYKTVIPRNVKLSEAPSHGKPALLYDIGCSGSIAYVEMAKEFLERERTKERFVV
jgi:chromosome partitioning protein